MYKLLAFTKYNKNAIINSSFLVYNLKL